MSEVSARGPFESWGRYPRAANQVGVPVRWRSDPLPAVPADRPLLPRGLGRSYGDACLNPGGALLLTRGLDRFIAFDPLTGVLRCEAGVSLAEILDLVVPEGWFLPVTPGTRFVTVGGAVANDVHGKNHHVAGTFGCHVRALELLRSTGERFVCSPQERAETFAATVGGLGLTGLITWVELQLRRIVSPLVEAETVRMRGLEEFFDLTAASDREYEFTVAWIDPFATGRSLGRGLFTRGNHAPTPPPPGWTRRTPRAWRVPFTPPGGLLNRWTARAFNAAYGRLAAHGRRTGDYEPFFYPLDAVRDWNRLYGPRGFLQYQCVLPDRDAGASTRRLLELVSGLGLGSFLAVLKQFGRRPSPGLLSFPRPGVTLALDLPHRGRPTLEGLDRLDELVREAGGAVYPAKDARMSGESFRAFFPRWRELAPHLDPRMSSGFWRRVGGPA